jgi:tryptophan synthase alpha chain
MNRIEECFARLKRDGKKGFIVYIGAGDPNLDATRELALAFDKAGVDILELGVPFSDPLADGLVNQLAAQRGLESKTTPPKLLETVAAIRKKSEIPIVLYIYFNLIHKVGLEKFIANAAKAGVDGLLVLDLPPEESDNYETLMKQAGLCHIYLVAPTTPEERMEFIVKRGSGFIYYISREGVTGMQTKVASNLASQIAKIRAHTDLPIAVGFGVSNPEQAKLVAQNADAVVVGSAVVNQIAEHGKSKDLVKRVSEFVKSLRNAVKMVYTPMTVQEIEVEKKLQTAFPFGDDMKLSHEDCVNQRIHLPLLRHEDLICYLGQVLCDLIKSHTGEPFNNEGLQMVLIFLDIEVVEIDFSRLGEKAARNLEEEAVYSRKSNAETASHFTSLQAEAIVSWLELARTWSDTKYDLEFLDSALAYWQKHSKQNGKQ